MTINPKKFDVERIRAIRASGKRIKTGGRKPAITPLVKQAIREGAARRYNVTELALHAGVGRRTLERYFEVHPEFKEEVLTLRNRLTIQSKNNTANAINGGDVVTSKWLLEKVDPEYQPTQKIQDVTPIVIIPAKIDKPANAGCTKEIKE